MGGWEDIYDYLDDVEKACATEMMKNKIPAPDGVGYELESMDSMEYIRRFPKVCLGSHMP